MLVDRADEVPGKAGDALRAHLAQVMLNRRLTELVRDVPLPVTPPDLAVRPWDRDAVHEVFDALQFRVLRDRLYRRSSPPSPRPTPASTSTSRCSAPGELGLWLTAHTGGGGRTGLALAGSWGAAPAT